MWTRMSFRGSEYALDEGIVDIDRFGGAFKEGAMIRAELQG